MKKILMVVADGFEELEAIAVADVLRRLGFQLTVAGLNGVNRIGAHQFAVSADVAFEDCDPAEFDALFLPGGMPGALNLYNAAAVVAAAKSMARAKKVVSAICAAPMVLAKAGLLDGRTFTMYPGFGQYIGTLVPTGNLAEADGNIVTGKGPGAVFAFAAKLAEALGEGGKIKDLYAGMFVNV